MRRRDAIALVGATSIVWPLAARPQQLAMPEVGFLGMNSPEAVVPHLSAFHAGLKQSGHVDGRNVVIAFRWGAGGHERLPALAAELVARKVAVIAATNPQTALAAKRATQTIPIAFIASDPVALGLVASLSRPGGNATGISVLSPELTPKRLELLRELNPNAKSVAVLANPAGPATVPQLAELQAAARITRHNVQVLEAQSESEIEQTFARLTERRPDALLVLGDPTFLGQREQIVALAARLAIPAIYDFPDFAAAGGLICYGPSLKDAFHLLGVYTGKILNGAKPADLPVQQPTRFELVINLTTAKALGLAIPPAILARADEVIE